MNQTAHLPKRGDYCKEYKEYKECNDQTSHLPHPERRQGTLYDRKGHSTSFVLTIEGMLF